MADSLYGYTIVPVPWPLIFFTGLAAGTYALFYEPDASGNPGVFTSAGNITVEDNGTHTTFGMSSGLPVEERVYYITTGANPTGDEGIILESFSAGWDNPSADNPYIDDAPVLSLTPGDGDVDADWTAATTFDTDARAELIYTLKRGTSSPPTTAVLSNSTSLTYNDTGVTNGVTYYYRVSADLRIEGSTTGFSVAKNSNIASTTPTGGSELVVSLSGVKGYRT